MNINLEKERVAQEEFLKSYVGSTEKLKQSMRNYEPETPIELNVDFTSKPIPLVHVFDSKEEAQEHLDYCAVLDKLSIERELAAMRGDDFEVTEIDKKIRQANQDYIRKVNV